MSGAELEFLRLMEEAQAFVSDTLGASQSSACNDDQDEDPIQLNLDSSDEEEVLSDHTKLRLEKHQGPKPSSTSELLPPGETESSYTASSSNLASPAPLPSHLRHLRHHSNPGSNDSRRPSSISIAARPVESTLTANNEEYQQQQSEHDQVLELTGRSRPFLSYIPRPTPPSGAANPVALPGPASSAATVPRALPSLLQAVNLDALLEKMDRNPEEYSLPQNPVALVQTIMRQESTPAMQASPSPSPSTSGSPVFKEGASVTRERPGSSFPNHRRLSPLPLRGETRPTVFLDLRKHNSQVGPAPSASPPKPVPEPASVEPLSSQDPQPDTKPRKSKFRSNYGAEKEPSRTAVETESDAEEDIFSWQGRKKEIPPQLQVRQLTPKETSPVQMTPLPKQLSDYELKQMNHSLLDLISAPLRERIDSDSFLQTHTCEETIVRVETSTRGTCTEEHSEDDRVDLRTLPSSKPPRKRKKKKKTAPLTSPVEPLSLPQWVDLLTATSTTPAKITLAPCSRSYWDSVRTVRISVPPSRLYSDPRLTRNLLVWLRREVMRPQELPRRFFHMVAVNLVESGLQIFAQVYSPQEHAKPSHLLRSLKSYLRGVLIHEETSLATLGILHEEFVREPWKLGVGNPSIRPGAYVMMVHCYTTDPQFEAILQQCLFRYGSISGLQTFYHAEHPSTTPMWVMQLDGEVPLPFSSQMACWCLPVQDCSYWKEAEDARESREDEVMLWESCTLQCTLEENDIFSVLKSLVDSRNLHVRGLSVNFEMKTMFVQVTHRYCKFVVEAMQLFGECPWEIIAEFPPTAAMTVKDEPFPSMGNYCLPEVPFNVVLSSTSRHFWSYLGTLSDKGKFFGFKTCLWEESKWEHFAVFRAAFAQDLVQEYLEVWNREYPQSHVDISMTSAPRETFQSIHHIFSLEELAEGWDYSHELETTYHRVHAGPLVQTRLVEVCNVHVLLSALEWISDCGITLVHMKSMETEQQIITFVLMVMGENLDKRLRVCLEGCDSTLVRVDRDWRRYFPEGGLFQVEPDEHGIMVVDLRHDATLSSAVCPEFLQIDPERTAIFTVLPSAYHSADSKEPNPALLFHGILECLVQDGFTMVALCMHQLSQEIAQAMLQLRQVPPSKMQTWVDTLTVGPTMTVVVSLARSSSSASSLVPFQSSPELRSHILRPLVKPERVRKEWNLLVSRTLEINAQP